MNILITGVNGFLGREISKYLFDKKYNIIGISLENNYLGDEKIRYIKADISKNNFLEILEENLLNNIDVIVHCAALINYEEHNLDLIKVNCEGFFNIVELAKKYHCKKIIYISSIQVIGKIKDIPIKETHEKEPLTLYHSTKLFGENYLNNISSIQKVIFRITSPIGKNMPKNKIMRVFVEKSLRNEDIVLLGKGKRVQNYIDVFDIARAIECAIEADNPNGVYNIASPKSISNIELAELCKFLLKSDSKILFNGVDKEEDNKWIVDTSKAEKELGFIAKKSIEESIFEIKEEIMKSENTFSK
ncbi:NAD-dependent epimerase/dehydratase family protein [Fusobacterium pseudoperiodonticum]|uniref:NAD-dependent epimerase/dehydratase domain-containing protein n=1 Tax=Fusobacterium pseudoperiodonticum TaxID=2663009 RepID=A0A2D3NX28_9FUSO|nr:NAD(P)-dependent oxidoreductase [Fusobacterium pseudoperiodonticum]ATV59900.1 hypothetical protein CTM72_09360 [Fusobacterium pseudoperiodonticum]